MCAYFSNGSEGDAFYEEFCERCIHNLIPDEEGGCPVYMLQLLWNYDAVGKNADETKRFALETLIPDKQDGNLVSAECRMFIKDENAVDKRQLSFGI